MSLIGEALNNKVSNDKSKNAFYYSDYIYGDGREDDKYTYSYLNDRVNMLISYIKQNYKDKKTCFLIIDNSIEDIAFFIALMELNIKPIIIHKDKLIELYLSNKDVEYMESNPDISNIQMPFDRGQYGRKKADYSKEASYISNASIRSYCYLSNIKNEIRIEKPLINKMLNYYLRKNKLLDILDQDDYDFGILTSGTTNNFKIQKVSEKELYDRIIANYDIETEETLVNTTPISSISGLLFDLYIPLLSKNNKMVCVTHEHFFPMQDEKGVMSVVLPGGRNIFEGSFSTPAEKKKEYLAHIKFNHIYFMGKKLTLENVKNVYDYVKYLSDDCIYNYYGNTENLGLICKCDQKHLKPIYLYGLYITNDKIIFSPDKENVYSKEIENDEIIIKKIDMDFNENLFIPILPISDDYKRDSKIIYLDDDNVFGELLVNDEATGDFGFEYDGLLYLAGRRNEFIQENNRYIFLTSLERAIDRFSESCSIARNESMTNAYIISDMDFIGDVSQHKYNGAYESLAGVKNFTERNNISIDNYVIIDKKDFPTGIEIGKIKKDFLLQYIFPKFDPKKLYDKYDDVLIDVFNKQLSSLLGRIVKVERQNDRYVFDKKHFSFVDLLTVIDNYQTYNFYEGENNYYLSIVDSFMTAKHPSSIKPIEDIYTILRSHFDDPNQKILLRINFYHFSSSGIQYGISKCDYLEPLTQDYDYDVHMFNDNGKEEFIENDHLIRFMKIREEEREKTFMRNNYWDFGRNSYQINIPFYFTAYMKNGKIYLEEYYKVQDEYKETSNKVYKIKKR